MSTLAFGWALSLVVLGQPASGLQVGYQPRDPDRTSLPTDPATKAGGLAAPTGKVQPDALPRLTVPGAAGRQVTLGVLHPDAASSQAWRINEDLVTKSGLVPVPTPGYRVHSRVIVESADPGRVLSIVEDSGLQNAAAELHENVRGFVIVSLPSVRDAAAAAAALRAAAEFPSVEIDLERPRVLRSVPDDPSIGNQWHLMNSSNPTADVNADGAWDQGYTGTGVVIGILEGGWQRNHPDLVANYNAAASQSGGSSTSHGTSCAGVAAASGFNGLGGSGLAFNAQLSDLIYGGVTQTASAFAHRNDLNDIKSNSWGPPDNGRLSYLPALERAAIEQAVQIGRDGLGTMFTWAGGNGGTNDWCDLDPYASHRMVFSIGAIGDQDRRSSYNETGASMLVVTQSNGNSRGIWTTTSGSSYTSSFGGTSSACPLAAGAVALMLEAKPDLSWRDVQAVLQATARRVDPSNPEWQQNAAGIWINENYGFGAIDAGAAVTAAATWTLLPPEISAETPLQLVDAELPDADPTGVLSTVEVDADVRIESVELRINVDTTYVGDLRIVITAPSGTESEVSVPRGDSQDDLTDYIFTSLRHWGESSRGEWSVRVADELAIDRARWIDYKLVFYGTQQCIADFDSDGTLDTSDVIAFINAFRAGEAEADANGDGSLDTSDLIVFINAFRAGC